MRNVPGTALPGVTGSINPRTEARRSPGWVWKPHRQLVRSLLIQPIPISFMRRRPAIRGAIQGTAVFSRPETVERPGGNLPKGCRMTEKPAPSTSSCTPRIRTFSMSASGSGCVSPGVLIPGDRTAVFLKPRMEERAGRN